MCIEGFDSKILEWLNIAQRRAFYDKLSQTGLVFNFFGALSEKHSSTQKAQLFLCLLRGRSGPQLSLVLQKVWVVTGYLTVIYMKRCFMNHGPHGEHLLPLQPVTEIYMNAYLLLRKETFSVVMQSWSSIKEDLKKITEANLNTVKSYPSNTMTNWKSVEFNVFHTAQTVLSNRWNIFLSVPVRNHC